MILSGDCLAVLPTLETESIQCCITSPPYWNLRDYKTPSLMWGGQEGCLHDWGNQIVTDTRGLQINTEKSTCSGPQVADARTSTRGCWCQSCGAWKGHLGLEPTPDLYVSHLVEIFREVRRVLRKDGTVFLNLGDSYVSSPRGNKPGDYSTSSLTNPERQDGLVRPLGSTSQRQVAWKINGLKPKDLVGIPWMVAFAFRADGWYLRQDIIWSKPNPMPESVTDRPTKAHEYLFLLSRSERYYYDAEAIREPATDTGRKNGRYGRYEDEGARPPGSSRRTLKRLDYSVLGRNKRSVWTIPTQPFPGAHFAVMPEALVEPCVKAGSRPGDLVLDPFAGSGTVGLVCKASDRRFLGIELNPTYLAMAERRIASIAPLFATGSGIGA